MILSLLCIKPRDHWTKPPNHGASAAHSDLSVGHIWACLAFTFLPWCQLQQVSVWKHADSDQRRFAGS